MTCVLSHVRFSATPGTWSPPGSTVHWISRQEYWNELPFPFPGDLPDTRIEPMSLISPARAGGFFTTNATWEAQILTGF